MKKEFFINISQSRMPSKLSTKNRIQWSLFFFLLIGVFGVHAQSLEALVLIAAEQNPELKALTLEYMAALKKAPQVSQLPDPEAGVGVFPLPVETRLGAQIIRLSATQMFPWFGTFERAKELETAKAKALYERIEARLLDLTYEVKQAYFQLYEIQQSQAIIQRNGVLLEALKNLALAKVESGGGSTVDVLRVQLKTVELNRELEILETRKRVPITTINQLLNRPPDTAVSITDSLLLNPMPFDKDTLASHIDSHHPMLQMYTLQQEISRQAISFNQINQKPSFGAGLDYILVDSRTDASPAGNGRDILQLRASVKIPISRKKYTAKEQEENLKIEALDYQKEALHAAFMATIEKAFAEEETARLQANLYREQIALTQSAVRILESAYSSEGRYFDELLQLEKQLIDYDLKMLKAIVQHHRAKSSIERFISQ